LEGPSGLRVPVSLGGAGELIGVVAAEPRSGHRRAAITPRETPNRATAPTVPRRFSAVPATLERMYESGPARDFLSIAVAVRSPA
jgi:hypothetical protein